MAWNTTGNYITTGRQLSVVGGFWNDISGKTDQNNFNAAEAQKQRDWEQNMSNTAHQREIQDLKAAGINPVLTATGGNGAATPSGASASGGEGSGAGILSGIAQVINSANAASRNSNYNTRAQINYDTAKLIHSALSIIKKE